ncbi:condensation domain-containing protein [Streptomyces triticirhizae]|uniref:Condensation domain-containing protein n=1 Tax=Streptomyces triticirhizae TaxID=2483353 RepID=A0A3M2L686_9ACTN|nr:condensation domain-containing protein [Streptomyces triticirhizae]RMI32506.1 hypothetical protein EBN88_25035 [Streptomyces triticirhizae]
MRADALSAERRALLRARLARRPAPGTVPLVRLPRPDGAVFPLSHQQEELWFLQRFAPESTAYNVPVVWRLRGSFAPEAVAAALNRLTARHEVLRTAFPERDGEPVQLPHPPAPWRLRVRHARSTDEATAIVREACERPFDLAAPGPLRPLLVLSPGGGALVLDLHHIVSDEWSERLLWRDFRHFYHAAHGLPTEPLPEPPAQYADFAAWQRARLAGGGLATLTGHWRDRLAGLPTLSLPLDRPRPRSQMFTGAVHRFPLPPAPAAALTALARAARATPFMAHLAVWVLTLARVTRQRDIAVGTITAGRDHPWLRDMVGFFVNTLVLRTDVAGAGDFVALLDRVRRTVLDAQAHQALPFPQVVEAVRPPRTPGLSPLVQVLYAYSAAGPHEERHLPGAKVTAEGVEMPVARFDLVLNVFQTPAETLCALEYNTALLRARTARRLAHLHTETLRRVVDDPRAALPLDGE